MKFVPYLLPAFIACSLRVFGQVDSATADSLVRDLVSSYDSAGYYYINPNKVQAGELFSLYKSYWVNDSYNDLELVSSRVDKSAGLTHNTYDHKFLNVPVEGAFMKEHLDQNGYVVWVNGRVPYNLDPNITQSIDEGQAILNVLNTLSGHSFYWDNPTLEQDLKDETSDPNATYFPAPSIIWARLPGLGNPRLFDKSQYELCWKFRILSESPELDRWYWVSAIDGAIVKYVDAIHENGPAETYYYGVRTVDSRWAGSITKHILDADDQGRNIHTKQNGWTNWSIRPNYKDADDNWDQTDIDGTSAHWVVMSAWDMFKNTSYIDLESTDGNAKEIRVVGNYAAQYSSTFQYNATKDAQVIGFGLTENEENETVTFATLDRAGHEFGHGVNEFLGGLLPQGEAYELEEGLCDIYGFLTERYTLDPFSDCTNTNDDCDWQMGEDQGLTRDIENPSSLNNPNTYQGTNYNPNASDHHHLNSTIMSHWFYLLAIGGSGTNDNSYTYNISGIGVDDAAEITFNTHINQVSGSDGFDQMRAGSIAQAISIHGSGSQEHVQTVCAWAAVGVGDEAECIALSSDRVHFDKKMGLKIYPNPGGGNSQFILPEPGRWIIKVFSTNGQLLKEFTSHEQYGKFDLNEFDSGVYIFEAHSDNGSYYSRYVKTSP